MLKNSVTKFRQHILSEHKRPMLTFILIAVASACVLAVAIIFVMGLISSPKNDDVSNISFSESVGAPEAGAEYDKAYRSSVESQNREDYKKARSQHGGMSIPFVLDDRPNDGSTNSNGTCGCEPMSDVQFREMLARNGVDFDGKSTLVRRVGNSDIYVDSNRFLVNHDGSGRYQFLQSDVRIGVNGVLEQEDSTSVQLPGGNSVFLSTDGTFIDKENRNVALQGSLLSPEGFLILGNGQLASRPNNMKREAETDIFITKEGQVATVDSKPIRHAGVFAFRNRERELVNRNRIAIRWENNTVMQNKEGYLTDPRGDVFKSEGILFSYDGILIDNLGKLTAPLLTINQLANSDLYIDENKNLKDRFGGRITNYGRVVNVSVGDTLRSEAHDTKNHKGAVVTIDPEGVLRVDVGKGGVQTGLLKNSLNVAYDRFGHLITRPGKLTQRGESDIFHTSDGLLSVLDGKPLKFKLKDIFFDYNAFLPNGLIGLRTFDGELVVDVNSQRIYLSESGEFLNSKSQPAILGVNITNTDGVVVRQNGSFPTSFNKEMVLGPNGKPLLHNGKPVYKTANGRLVYADNSPVLDEEHGSLYLSDSGVITSEAGTPVILTRFSTQNGNIKSGTFDTAEQILTASGKALEINGRKIYKKNGKLIYSNGEPVRDALNSPLHIDPETGAILNAEGQENADINRQMGKGIFGNSYPLTANGEPIFVNGKRAFVQADGSIVDENGELITSADGSVVYFDAKKGLVDANGAVIDGMVVATASGEIVTAQDVDQPPSSDLVPVTKGGQALYHNGKPVYRRADGTLVDANNKPIMSAKGTFLKINDKGKLVDENNNPVVLPFLTDAKGNFITNEDFTAGFKTNGIKKGLRAVTKNGKPLFYAGKPVYQRADGTLVDAENNVITTTDGKVIRLNDNGELIDGKGNVLTESLLTEADGSPTDNKDIDILTATGLLTKDGKPVYVNGQEVFVRSDGTLVDAFDRIIKGPDGEPLRLNGDNKIVDAAGNLVALATESSTLNKNKGFSSRNNDNFGDLSVQDGFVLGTDGKPLTFKGKRVIRKADGYLYTEDGKRIETSDGRPVTLNENGEFVDSKGNVIQEALFADGEGTLLYGNGKPVTSLMKRIGDSDVYLTRDGHIVTDDGKSYQYRGKAVKIDPKTGQLIDEDNKAIRDGNGNHVMLSETGKFVNRNSQPVTTLGITSKNGKLLTSAGMLSNHITDLTPIPGTSYFQTPDGAVVDADGVPVKLNGNIIYTNEKGRLLNNKEQRLRYHGQSLSLDADGYLVDSKNERIMANGRPVMLAGISKLEEQPEPTSPARQSSVISLPGKADVSNNLVPAVTDSSSEVNEKSAKTEVDRGSSSTVHKVDLTSSNYSDRNRLAQRFKDITTKIEQEVVNIKARANSSNQSASKYVDLPEQPLHIVKMNKQDKNLDTEEDVTEKTLVKGAGENLYAVTTQEMNSDLNDELEVQIISGKRGSKIYLAVAYAKVVLKYDNAVLQFNRICPVNGKCETFTGTGLDPVTGSAGLAADVDSHFWYRYGGLFLAQFGAGVSAGISDSIDSETETVSDGTSTSTVRSVKGLDYNEIAIKGLAETGNAFIPSLAQRIGRPVTAHIPAHTELIIKLTQPLYL